MLDATVLFTSKMHQSRTYFKRESKLLKMTDEKQQNLELIEVYRSLPALWDVKCEEYTDRNIKDEQYNVLLKCFNKYNPEGQLADLKRKINSLRTNFRRELKRITNLERRGAGDASSTTLYYYDALSFLEDVISPVEPSSTLYPENTKKLKRRHSDDDFFLESYPLQVGGDAFGHLIKAWTEKLYKLDNIQKMFAEKVINEVFLNGQLGLLSLNTTLTQTSKQEPLNKQQFVEAFKHFLQTDDEFVEKLHEAYLNLKQNNKHVKRH